MTTPDAIETYAAALPAEHAAMTRLLRAEIDAALPKATSKVWHGHPVWFDGENPVVGYDARKASVNLLFWNGQALGEPALEAVGKFRAAGVRFTRAAEIDRPLLRRWLKKARSNVFDGVRHFRTLREAAKAAATPKPSAVKPAKARPTPSKRTATAAATKRPAGRAKR